MKKITQSVGGHFQGYPKSCGFSVSEQFAEGLLGGFLAAEFALGAVDFLEIAPGKFEILAVIGAVFFVHRLGSALAALVGNGHVEVQAVFATAQVGVAFLANVTSPGKVGQRPVLAAVEAMPCHAISLKA